MAPTVSFEQLAYDCRLMNKAAEKSPETALLMRDLLAGSDSCLDPQAYILRPDVVLDISNELVKVDGYYPKAKKAAALALSHIRKGFDKGKLQLNDKESMWLEQLSETVDGLPGDTGEFIDSVIDDCQKLDPKKYDM